MSSSSDEGGGESLAKNHLRLLITQCSSFTRKVLSAENPEDEIVLKAIEGGKLVFDAFLKLTNFTYRICSHDYVKEGLEKD